jgi:hypothetical protein
MGKDDGGAEAFYGRSRGRLLVRAVSPNPASKVSDYPNGVQPFPVAGLPSYYLLLIELLEFKRVVTLIAIKDK